MQNKLWEKTMGCHLILSLQFLKITNNQMNDHFKSNFE